MGKGGMSYPTSPDTTASIAESPGRGLGRKLIRLMIVLFGAAVLGAAGYFGYQYFLASKNTTTPKTEINSNEPQNENTPTETPDTTVNTNDNVNVPSNVNSPVNTNTNTVTQAPLINENINVPGAVFLPPQDDPKSTLDTDRDGLTDYEEAHKYFTDLTKPDTDNDGLTDRDEVVTWKTDPLKADTDGDTFSDGSEVKNGYNPLGPGKLLPQINR